MHSPCSKRAAAWQGVIDKAGMFECVEPLQSRAGAGWLVRRCRPHPARCQPTLPCASSTARAAAGRRGRPVRTGHVHGGAPLPGTAYCHQKRPHSRRRPSKPTQHSNNTHTRSPAPDPAPQTADDSDRQWRPAARPARGARPLSCWWRRRRRRCWRCRRLRTQRVSARSWVKSRQVPSAWCAAPLCWIAALEGYKYKMHAGVLYALLPPADGRRPARFRRARGPSRLCVRVGRAAVLPAAVEVQGAAGLLRKVQDAFLDVRSGGALGDCRLQRR